MVTETTGALSPTFDRALRALGKHARAPTTHDSTRYGLSRSSPRTFLAHHRAAISAAVVLADATTVLLAAPAMSFKLTMGMAPFYTAPARYPPWCECVCVNVNVCLCDF
jgi:hypothetical protein